MITHLQISPSDYIRELRMEAAREMLQNTSKNVGQVAFEVGFKDPTHFARAYRKKYGVTPKNDQNTV